MWTYAHTRFKKPVYQQLNYQFKKDGQILKGEPVKDLVLSNINANQAGIKIMSLYRGRLNVIIQFVLIL